MGLERVKDSIKVLTEVENLPNHYKAIQARLEK
jgi:histidinol dehydrogenase